MKTESTVKYVLRIALTLLAITAVVAVILAAVNSVTAPRIAAQNEQKTQNAIEAVLPGGGQEVKEFTDDTGLVTAAYKGDNGCAVQVTPAGFNGTVTMMVGVDNDGKVTGISIISHTETAGLGATAAADTDAVEAVMRAVFAHPEAYEALRARGTRDARRLTWAHNAEITAGVYREAMEHWRKEHAQAGH